MEKKQPEPSYMTPHPHLTRLIELIAYDNGIPMKPHSHWNWPGESASLEVMAGCLSEAEKDVLATEEHSLQSQLILAMGLQPLDAFLTEVFDGEYRWHFYEE
jgi:hypothetical protein